MINQSCIQYIRRGLGMTLKDLAHRMDVNTSAIAQAERNELSGTITLERLRKIANAMDCDLAYAFIPKDERSDIQGITMKHATEKAKRLLKSADVHMELEDHIAKALQLGSTTWGNSFSAAGPTRRKIYSEALRSVSRDGKFEQLIHFIFS